MPEIARRDATPLQLISAAVSKMPAPDRVARGRLLAHLADLLARPGREAKRALATLDHDGKAGARIAGQLVGKMPAANRLAQAHMLARLAAAYAAALELHEAMKRGDTPTAASGQPVDCIEGPHTARPAADHESPRRVRQMRPSAMHTVGETHE